MIIYDINYDTNLNDGTTTNFKPKDYNYLQITTDDNKKLITSITDGNSDKSITTSHTNIPVVCDRVYPLYLATKDIELSKNNNKLDQNVLRCAYSKICGVPWTDINCDKYNLK